MATFVITEQIWDAIHQIIDESEKNIFLVSPYLQISESIQFALTNADGKGKIITLIFGKVGLNYSQEAFLQSLQNLELYYCYHLHAKCYFNEANMVISSMNLYEASTKNIEMGIQLSSSLDAILYNACRQEVDFLISSSSKLEKQQLHEAASNILPIHKILDTLTPALNEVYMYFKAYWRQCSFLNALVNEQPTLVIRGLLSENCEVQIRGIVKYVFFDQDVDFFRLLKARHKSDTRSRFSPHAVYWNVYIDRNEVCIYFHKSGDTWSDQAMFQNVIGQSYEYLKNALCIK